MKSWSRNIITVYEHEKLTLKHPGFTVGHLEALERYYGQRGTPYFSLIRNGVKFNQYVGVIQAGDVFIEVLPKMDRHGDKVRYGSAVEAMTHAESGDETGGRSDEAGGVDADAQWQSVLIRMLKIAMDVEASETSESRLSLKGNTILDLYLELFIRECEKLVRRGLVRRYRRVAGNSAAVRGKLNMSTHLRTNLIHKERFYIEYSLYDRNHLIHQILHETLILLSSRYYRPGYYSRVKNLLLEFDHCDRISPVQKHFDGIELNRKTEHYRRALNIARLILLNFHPDITRGQMHILALMFDMNQLWEKYVGRLMRKFLGDRYVVEAQRSAGFWMPIANGRKRRLRPDFVLTSRTDPAEVVVIDTKWKVVDGQPSDEDLRQIFAYNHLFKTVKGILLYPGAGYDTDTNDRNESYPSGTASGNAGKFTHGYSGSAGFGVRGRYLTPAGGSCSMVHLNILNDNGELRYDRHILMPLEANIFEKGYTEEVDQAGRGIV